MKAPITTHVLDTARGCPAAGIMVTLSRRENDRWVPLGEGVTDADGRAGGLIPADHTLEAGVYRIRFETGPYLAREGDAAFYPRADVVFTVTGAGQHYHIPLLLSPFGYSTYRGS